MYKIIILTFISVLLFESCSSMKDQNNTPSKEMTEFLQSKISPDHCRIKGRVDSRSTQGLSVYVDSVLGYGSGFKSKLAAGKTISLSFISSTGVIPPEGKFFYSDIKETLEMGQNTSEKYTANKFILLNH